jgi:hypothetical protein
MLSGFVAVAFRNSAVQADAVDVLITTCFP